MSDYATDTTMFRSLAQIERAAGQDGSYFFSPATLRFFRSRISENVYPVPGGALFVTSEQFVPFDGPADARRYTVRLALRNGHGGRFEIQEIGEFQQYGSRSGAHTAAQREASRRRHPCNV